MQDVQLLKKIIFSPYNKMQIQKAFKCLIYF